MILLIYFPLEITIDEVDLQSSLDLKGWVIWTKQEEKWQEEIWTKFFSRNFLQCSSGNPPEFIDFL
jgi:hypothetical protein